MPRNKYKNIAPLKINHSSQLLNLTLQRYNLFFISQNLYVLKFY